MRVTQYGHSFKSPSASKKEKLHEKLLDSIPGLVAYIDTDLCYRYVNTAYKKWNADEDVTVVGQTVSQVHGEETLTAMRPYLAAALLGEPSEFRGHYKDGRYADFKLMPDLEKGEVQGFILYIYNVSEKKSRSKSEPSERKIRNGIAAQEGVNQKMTEVNDNEEKDTHPFQYILETLPVAVFTCDEKGSLQYYNPAAVTLLGKEPECEEGPWEIPYHQTENSETVIDRADGTRSAIIPYAIPIKNDGGHTTGMIHVLVNITEQKQSIQKTVETRYHNLLQSLPAAVYTCDEQGRITSFNQTAADLWGRVPELRKDLWCGSWKIYRPDGAPLPLESCPMAIVLKDGRPVLGQEIVVERPDGEKRHVAPHPRPLFDEKGNLTGAINLLVDITEQKKVEQTLRESEARFRLMADLAPVVIWMTNEKGGNIYLNKQWGDLTGKKVEEGHGYGWLDQVHPGDRDRVYQEWQKAFTERLPFNGRFRYMNRLEGYVITGITGRPRYSDDGQFIGYIGIQQDITFQENTKLLLENEIRERMDVILKRNEELRRSEERYHRMVDEVQDYVIILLDKDGVIQNWNKGAQKIKGYSADEAIGKSFKIFYNKGDREDGLPERLLGEARSNGKANHEGWRVRKDGSSFWGSVVITALHDEENNIIGFSKMTRDLTEKKAAEERLKAYALQLEKKSKDLEKMNQELASFAYVSSHDLQEPLRKIQTFATRILEIENESLSGKGKDYFGRIQNAASRMQTLIEDLLTYSRTDTVERKFEPTDLNLLLRSVKNELKESIEEKNAVIESTYLPQLNVTAFQFHQLLINLLSNALKFAKQNVAPHIVIAANLIKGDQIRSPRAEPSRLYHHISIADNGIGFEPEYQVKIFEVFQRLHGKHEYSGTGIGLAICKKIVENHGGIITAEGKINVGATFHIYMPV